MKKRGFEKHHYSVLFIFFVGAILGFFVGFVNGKSKASDEVIEKNVVLEKQVEKAKNMFPVTGELFSVSGKITATNGNMITIDAFPGPNPLEELPKVRTITIGTNTRIIELRQKTAAEMEAEYNEAKRKASDPSMVPPPTPFGESELELSDLEVGAMISASSETNIKTATEFAAKVVMLQQSAASAATGADPMPPPTPEALGRVNEAVPAAAPSAPSPALPANT